MVSDGCSVQSDKLSKTDFVLFFPLLSLSNYVLHAHLIAHRINEASESRFPSSIVSHFKQFFVAVLTVGVTSRTMVVLSQDCALGWGREAESCQLTGNASV